MNVPWALEKNVCSAIGLNVLQMLVNGIRFFHILADFLIVLSIVEIAMLNFLSVIVYLFVFHFC